ncbi:MAG: AAA family ATPase [Thomasclavelia sp.]
MGIYLNPDNEKYAEMLRGEVFVDHSLLIEKTNHLIRTPNKMLCVSRPRRFGKSTDANMLVAYYSKGCDSSQIFNRLKISQTELYQKHLNQHNVIHINMQDFLSISSSINDMVELLSEEIIEELDECFKVKNNRNILSLYLLKTYNQIKEKFIFVIDEWDCIFREYKNNKEAQSQYLDFLRNLLKDKPYVSLCYMTGILPIKKYGTHSALNMFKEVSILNPTPLEEFMGFTEKEVQDLCLKYDMDYEKMKDWYDGYKMTDDLSVYNHRSVVYALMDRKYENYWSATETYEALRVYIDMNYDGLKDDIVKLLAGEHVAVQTTSFQNDMTTFDTKDDVLTLLIHLGYLGYNSFNQTCYIPNKEVIDSFVNSIRSSNWNETTKALLNSRALLEATWNRDEELVAKYIEEAHLDTAILTYNNENALSYTISIAYIYARNHYTIIREMPSGKGYADMVFIPKDDKPAMIVELKWDHEAETAIDQIKEKKYPKGLEEYRDNLLIVGISYDKKTKKHSCRIEEVN